MARPEVTFALSRLLVMPNGMSIFVNVRQLLGYDIRRATTVTAGLRVGF